MSPLCLKGGSECSDFDTCGSQIYHQSLPSSENTIKWIQFFFFEILCYIIYHIIIETIYAISKNEF